MSINTNTSVQRRVVSAFFDTAGAAKTAVDDLVAAGIPRQHINQTSGDTAGEPVTGRADAGEEKGFWESLKDLFLPVEDRHTYAEGLSRGGELITVNTEEGNYERVLDILDRDGAVNMDEREGSWRNEGWTGYRGAGATTGAPLTGMAAADLLPGTPAAIPAATGTGAATGPGSITQNYQTDDAARAAALGTSPATAPAATGLGTTDTARTEAATSLGSTASGAFGSAPTDAIAVDSDGTAFVGDDRWEAGRRDLSHGRSRVRSYLAEQPGLTGTFSASDSARITPHMDVIAADGQKIGEVDHLDGPDRIKLAKSSSPDGQHHYVPFTWIDHVDQHVHLKKTLAEIRAGQGA